MNFFFMGKKNVETTPKTEPRVKCWVCGRRHKFRGGKSVQYLFGSPHVPSESLCWLTLSNPICRTCDIKVSTYLKSLCTFPTYK